MLSLVPGFQKSHHHGCLGHGILLCRGSWPVRCGVPHSIRGLPPGAVSSSLPGTSGTNNVSLLCCSVGSRSLWPHELQQAPPSMGFSRQGCWSGLPFPPPGVLPKPRNQTHVSCIGRWILYSWTTREPQNGSVCCQMSPGRGEQVHP